VAKRKKANPWDAVFNRVDVRRDLNSFYAPRATDTELDGVEKPLGSRLPTSYREFLKRFGSGRLHDWLDVYGVSKSPIRTRSVLDLVDQTNQFRGLFGSDVGRSNSSWLHVVVYFGNAGGNANYVWDPAAITSTRPREYRVYELGRHEEESPVLRAESFSEFLQWYDALIRDPLEPADIARLGPGIRFDPRFLRKRKGPAKPDVKLWLAFNDSTVRNLALSIRDEKRPDAFPILADALEEAGCTNADMLESCRRGDPDIDGLWVLRVLLGDT
jgi:hypothetical protein